MKAFLVLLFLTCLSWANPIPKYASGNYPVFQTSTSDTEVHFSAILPRLKDYVMRAYPIESNGEGHVIQSNARIETLQDSQKQLHEKVMHFQFQGLNPKTKYRLEVVEISKFGEKVVEQRYFKSMDQTPRPLKFAALSCMSDEKDYAEPRDVLWKKLAASNLDAVFLLGDMTYVDSFNFVERNKATEFDIWNRTIESAKSLPLAYYETLIPMQFTWDDHDAGVDNANKDYPMIAVARAATNAVYGGHDIAGVIEHGQGGVHKYVKWAGQHFFLLDNRSFRTSHKENVLYGHFGEVQETWLFNHLAQIQDSGPVYLMSGDMWGSQTILKPRPEGEPKRLTESFFGDHPANYDNFMKKLNETKVHYVQVSGDIHFSQIMGLGPQEKGNSRYAPFETWEITSSPMHSIMFGPAPGEPEFWKDDQRIVANRNYNFVVINSSWDDKKKALKIDLQSIGIQEKPLFQLGSTITRTPEFNSKRQTILDNTFSRTNNKVKVAAFDADATLRVAPSKTPTASHATDVYILPNVANKIAELARQGYMIVIFSNQGGVYSGLNSYKEVDAALHYTMDQIRAQNPNAKFHYYDMALEKDGDYYRKPDVGMMRHLERVLARQGLSVDWANTYYVGDAQYKKTDIDPLTGKPGLDFTNTDRLFAENLGIKTYHPFTFFNWTPEQLEAVRKYDIDFLKKSTAAKMACRKAVGY